MKTEGYIYEIVIIQTKADVVPMRLINTINTKIHKAMRGHLF
jgi:hypothetical protein